jgi:hypothetical protein
VTHYLNNGNFGTKSQNVYDPVGAGIPMLIGGLGGAPLNGEIAELLVYNTALNTSNLTAVWNYVTNKYNIQYSTPAVAITSQTNGETITGPTDVTVSVSDPEGTVASVQLYLNGNLLATVTAPPYQFTLTLVGAGTGTLTAVATDSLGITASSTPVSLTYNGTTNYTPGTNLQLWLEANVGVVTNAGGGVTGWNDQSGHNNNAYLGLAGTSSKATANIQANPAVLDASFLNGQPGIRFYGANSEFLEVPYSAGLDITGDITSVAVVEDNAQSNARFVWWNGGWSGYPSPNGVMTGGSSSFSMIRGNGGSQQEYAFASNPYFGQPNLVVDIQAGTTYTQFLDGGLNVGAITVNGSPASAYTLTPSDGEGNSPLFISARGDAWAMGDSDMEIAELMIFNNALSGTNLGSVLSYINAKYYGHIAGYAVQTPQPTLSVARQLNGSVLISWPQSYNGYILESTSSLRGSWVAVSGVANNQVNVTPAGGQVFYRLRLP